MTRRLRDLNHGFKRGSNYRRHVVLLSSVLKIPQEIEKDLAVVDFDLPRPEDIAGIVDRLLASLPQLETDARTSPDVRQRIVDAAMGLVGS